MDFDQPMTDDEYIEACARSVVAVHGTDSLKFIAERLDVLSLMLQIEAIETWQRIRRKVNQL